MSGEDYALIALAETTKDWVTPCDSEQTSLLEAKKPKKNLRSRSFYWKLPKLRLAPKLSRMRHQFRKLNCIDKREDEDDPILPMDVPRHKSIDIGIGLARRMSLFIFTRRSVCVHPYHPFTPKQTTRKIFFGCDDKK